MTNIEPKEIKEEELILSDENKDYDGKGEDKNGNN